MRYLLDLLAVNIEERENGELNRKTVGIPRLEHDGPVGKPREHVANATQYPTNPNINI